MSRAADAVNNPFIVEDQATPPMRSAFAILGADRDDVLKKTVDEIFRAAWDILRLDPENAAVYGQAVTEAELRDAASKLKDPASQTVSHLLDYRAHAFDLADVQELRSTLTEYRDRLVATEPAALTDLGLLGTLLTELAGNPTIPALESFEVTAPDLPLGESLLSDLA